MTRLGFCRSRFFLVEEQRGYPEPAHGRMRSMSIHSQAVDICKIFFEILGSKELMN